MVDGLLSKRLIVMTVLLTVMTVSVVTLITILSFPTYVGCAIEFQTISKGGSSGHKASAYYVIQNEDEWADVWNQHESISLPQRPPPEVNFSETTIIAVFMGEFNTGGYGIEIKEILDMNQSVAVKVEKGYPGNGCLITQAITHPYHFVKTDKIDKEIIFDTTERTIECQ